jgi:hypothetical protein
MAGHDWKEWLAWLGDSAGNPRGLKFKGTIYKKPWFFTPE